MWKIQISLNGITVSGDAIFKTQKDARANIVENRDKVLLTLNKIFDKHKPLSLKMKAVKS